MRSRSIRNAVVSVIAVVAVAGAALVAAPAGTRTNTVKVEAVCPPAKPGFVSCLGLRLVPAAGARPAVTPSGFGPADLTSAYNIPAGLGAGRTVALVNAFDAPNAEADLAVYRSQFGLPACTTANGCFRKVNQTGLASPLPHHDEGWAQESTLDIDMVSALCPLCHILLVEASAFSVADMGISVNKAVALGAVAVSNSYGGPESAGDPTTTASYYDHPGVAITAAASDNGYTVEYPASSPDVVAVGGTSLTRSPATPRGWTERVWGSATNSLGGTGSGCSTLEPKPAWQTDTGCTHRINNDVAAVGDPSTGVAVYETASGGWLVFGGTSVSSPIVASIFAMANPAAADAYPAQYLYGDTADLNDVTAGTNGHCTVAYFCTAGAGYDGPSGLGTPNGVTAFGPPAAPPAALALSPKSGPAGTLVTVTGTGFAAGHRVKVRYATGVGSPATVPVCHAQVAADGTLGCSGKIPVADSGAAGRHRVSALDVTTKAIVATAAFRLQ